MAHAVVPRRTRPRRLAVVALVVVLSGVVLVVGARYLTSGDPPPAIPAVDLDTGWQWTAQAAPLDLGVTHTQVSLNPGSPAESRDRGQAVLDAAGHTWQNQHLMGFGTLNPEPSPGQYDWSSLDARMALIRDTGGRTVLTACCAPDWMKGGQAGQTDWSQLEMAPDPAYFDAFASLTAQAVQRYPQIQAVMVWNELKGFFHSDRNRWDYENYTDLYNKVYRAVKQVRPDVLVGGPYAPVTSLQPGDPFASRDLVGAWGAADQRVLDALTYWLKNAVGADFVAVDGPTRIGSDEDTTPPKSVEVGAAKFADVTTWLHRLSPLPVWWAEFYADVPEGVPSGATASSSAAAALAGVAAFARSGSSVALLWGPEGSSLPYPALWTSATVDDGGAPTPLTSAWDWLEPRLAADQIRIGRSSTSSLLAFRAADGAVVVNLSGEDVPLHPDSPVFPAWGVSVQK